MEQQGNHVHCFEAQSAPYVAISSLNMQAILPPIHISAASGAHQVPCMDSQLDAESSTPPHPKGNSQDFVAGSSVQNIASTKSLDYRLHCGSHNGGFTVSSRKVWSRESYASKECSVKVGIRVNEFERQLFGYWFLILVINKVNRTHFHRHSYTIASLDSLQMSYYLVPLSSTVLPQLRLIHSRNGLRTAVYIALRDNQVIGW
jgi:hypothetical protein